MRRSGASETRTQKPGRIFEPTTNPCVGGCETVSLYRVPVIGICHRAVTSGWPTDLPSVTFGDLSIALAQAVGMPGSAGGDSLLGGQGRVDDRGSAGHVYRLEALHDRCGHLADLPRQQNNTIHETHERQD